MEGPALAITEIASLATVKQYLRIPNPAQPNPDDFILGIMMGAAQETIERELGHIVAKNITAERHNGGKRAVWLREIPVLYISNVEEGWGYYDWELDDQQVNQIPALSIWAYSLDNPQEGLLTRRSAGNVNIPFVCGVNNIRVDYVAGRTEMPQNAELAFCELVSFWYRNSQLRAINQAGTLGAGAATAFGAVNQDFTRTTAVASINQGVPAGVIELLKPNRRRPIIG